MFAVSTQDEYFLNSKKKEVCLFHIFKLIKIAKNVLGERVI
jgi:hypothetical protein